MVIGREPDVNLVLQWGTKRTIVLSLFSIEQWTLAAAACHADYDPPPRNNHHSGAISIVSPTYSR